MDDEQLRDEIGSTSASASGKPAAAIFVKKRNRARGAAAASVSSSGRVNALASDDASALGPSAGERQDATINEDGEKQEQEQDGDNPLGGAVRRTAGLRGRGKARGMFASSREGRGGGGSSGTGRSSTGSRRRIAVSHADDDDEGENDHSAFTIRKDVRSVAQGTLSSLDALPSSLQRHATINDEEDDAGASYSAASLAALKAATPNARHAPSSDADHNDGHDSSDVRHKFDADFAHPSIPSEAAIQAAKEKRRRAMATASADGQSESADFISLNGNQVTRYQERGPHPESRLPREEDQEGSGEEEFADFTGATERVALFPTEMERDRRRERRARKEEVEDMAINAENADEESENSEVEWERAQLGRAGSHGLGPSKTKGRKPKEHTEKKPYRPAPIPRTAPLPSISSTSVVLQQKLSAIEGGIAAQEHLHNDAKAQLAQLQLDEERNKRDTEAAAEREAWFREFESFIVSMASFLEQKLPLIGEVEVDWAGHLAVRTRLVQKARADAITDQIALFYGVPGSSLYTVFDASDHDKRSPQEDGHGLSETRVQRRATAALALKGDLLPADQAAFDAAQLDIRQRVSQILDDVQAAEYREPGARIALDGNQTTLHPASLVARFHRWRTLYPHEYNNAWGGLTLASMWDFWIRRSLCGWDVFRLKDQSPRSLDAFSWYIDLSHYSDLRTVDDEEKSEVQGPLGGDDEVMMHAMTMTVVPLLRNLFERGAFDPWSDRDHASALEIVEQITYVLEKDDAVFQSLIAAVLKTFEPHVAALVEALNGSPAMPAPALSPEGPSSLLDCTQFVYTSLVRHLIAWHRFARGDQMALLVRLTETFVEGAFVTLLDMAKYVVGGTEMVERLVRDLLTHSSRSKLLQERVRAQLEQLAGLP